MPQHFQNEQLELQGLLWAGLTLGLFPMSPSQEVPKSIQMPSLDLAPGLQAAGLSGALPCPALPQTTDQGSSLQRQLALQILPAILRLHESSMKLVKQPSDQQACSVQHL